MKVLVKLQAEVCNFTKSITPPWVFFMHFCKINFHPFLPSPQIAKESGVYLFSFLFFFFFFPFCNTTKMSYEGKYWKTLWFFYVFWGYVEREEAFITFFGAVIRNIKYFILRRTETLLSIPNYIDTYII